MSQYGPVTPSGGQPGGYGGPGAGQSYQDGIGQSAQPYAGPPAADRYNRPVTGIPASPAPRPSSGPPAGPPPAPPNNVAKIIMVIVAATVVIMLLSAVIVVWLLGGDDDGGNGGGGEEYAANHPVNAQAGDCLYGEEVNPDTHEWHAEIVDCSADNANFEVYEVVEGTSARDCSRYDDRSRKHFWYLLPDDLFELGADYVLCAQEY